MPPEAHVPPEARVPADPNVAGAQRGSVMITGASSGIGAAAAQLLAHKGFTVFAGVRKDSDGEELKAVHKEIRPVHLDVADSVAIAAAAQTVAAAGLPLAGLINNAGIALGGPLEFLPVDELRRQFEVNVFGAVAVTQAFLPQLREARGRLLFVGSVSGRVAMPFLSPYSSSKFALRAIADALRVELAPWHISVSLIEPGSVKTPIWRKGHESREVLLQQLGPQAQAYYKEELEALFHTTEREERTGMPVQRVMTAIMHALDSARPRAYYPVGSALAKFLGLLPASFQDRMMRASLRRP